MRAKDLFDRAKWTGNCFEWQGARNTKGYGYVRIGRKMVPVHRLVFSELVGVIPDGHYVLHHCDNPPCIWPAHLFSGTHQDNMDDRHRKGRYIGPRGEQQGVSRLSAADVLSMRAAYRPVRGALPVLSRRYGVSVTEVFRIVKGQRWQHLLPKT